MDRYQLTCGFVINTIHTKTHHTDRLDGVEVLHNVDLTRSVFRQANVKVLHYRSAGRKERRTIGFQYTFTITIKRDCPVDFENERERVRNLLEDKKTDIAFAYPFELSSHKEFPIGCCVIGGRFDAWHTDDTIQSAGLLFKRFIQMNNTELGCFDIDGEADTIPYRFACRWMGQPEVGMWMNCKPSHKKWRIHENWS